MGTDIPMTKGVISAPRVNGDQRSSDYEPKCGGGVPSIADFDITAATVARRSPLVVDAAAACAERHLVECCFSKLKQFRRVATRFEKTARNYRAVVTLAAIILWMR